MITAEEAIELMKETRDNQVEQLLVKINAMVIEAVKDGRSSCGLDGIRMLYNPIRKELNKLGYKVIYNGVVNTPIYTLSWSREDV